MTIEIIVSLVRNQAVVRTMAGAVIKILGWFSNLVVFVPAIALRIAGVRFLPIHVQRVGHLALEPDCYIKEEMLALRPHYRAVVCAPRKVVANQHLLEYWRPFFTILQAPALCFLLKPLARHPLLRVDVGRYAVALDRVAGYVGIQRQWNDRPPVVRLTEDDQRRGRRLLSKLGVPKGAWFICVHSRESGYSPIDEHWHSFRNSDIETYRRAMEEIVGRGGWCIRIGDPTMKKMVPMDGVIDYAHSEHRSDWMDVFLCASCVFFLGNSSGPCVISSIFGVPVALANLAPLGVVLPFGSRDIGIPKLVRAVGGNVLSFREVLESPVSTARFAAQFRELGVEVVDNTPEEIASLALEQLGRAFGTIEYTAKDEELQNRFKSLMKENHYTFGSSSRIGRDFLRSYAHLLSDPSGKLARV